MSSFLYSQKHLPRNVKVKSVKEKIQLDFYFDTKRIRKLLDLKSSATNLKNIEKRKLEIAMEIVNENLHYKTELTLKEASILALKESARDRSSEVQKDYENILNSPLLKTILTKNIADVKPRDLELIVTKLITYGLSLSRAKKFMRCVKFGLNYAEKNDLIQKNPAKFIELKSSHFKKSDDKESKYYSKSEMDLIMDDDEDLFIQLWVNIAFTTGLRTGELLALRYDAFDLDKVLINIDKAIRKGVLGETKTKKSRLVPMTDKVKELVLKKQKQTTSPWVFVNPKTRKPYWDAKSIVRYRFKPLLERLGIKYKGFYETRHSFGSFMFESGADLALIQSIMGHSIGSMVTSNHYLKFSQMQQEKRVEKINELFS